MTNQTLSMHPIKTLTFSSASALVQIGSKFCTISDDQLCLEVFSERADEASEFFPIFPGELPTEAKLRKAAKPDLEALLELASEVFSTKLSNETTLLALPSGSTERRRRGAWLKINSPFVLHQNETVDFTELYLQLERQLPELNIEGAVFAGPTLKLFQRGNGAKGMNAVVDLDAAVFLEELQQSQKITANSFRRITEVPLPKIGDVTLSFTDAAVDLRNHGVIWFLAAAEESLSTYEDGIVSGAILGCLNESNVLLNIWPLEITQKPEGLCLSKTDVSAFYVVTDTDNPEIPSNLFKGSLPDLNRI